MTKLIVALLVICMIGIDSAMAIEEPTYTVIQQDGKFSLRQYTDILVAETLVSGNRQSAGNAAFRPLFRYISGNNEPNTSIAMTAPVTQQGQKIAMTAPVVQEQHADRWSVHFVMPREFTLETLPKPLDPNVTIRQIPARTVAVIRYGGRWTQERYQTHEKALREWIEKQGFTVAGDPIWARYNAPFTPSFMRRNEIWIPLANQPEENPEP
ncbi:MAG: SOUL family heme-binding protein [Kiritimatiellia bacterium]